MLFNCLILLTLSAQTIARNGTVAYEESNNTRNRAVAYEESNSTLNGNLDRSIITTWDSFFKFVKPKTNEVVRRVLPHLLRSLSLANLNEKCERDLMRFALSLMKWNTWAVHMIDASGKIPSGVLDGTIMDLGSYDRCLAIKVNESPRGKEAFRGRYCLVGYKNRLISPMTENTATGESYIEAYGHPPEWIADVIERSGPYLKKVSFWLGTCIPSTCSEDDAKKIFIYVTEPFGFNVSIASCDVEEPFIWPKSAVVSFCILFCVLGLCVLGSLLDIASRHDPRILELGYLFQIFKAFSLLSNTEALFETRRNNTLSCFHGIRFFSASWIILGHTYFFTDTWKYLRYRNLIGIYDKFNGYLPAAILENFTIPVSSFFFMSGFLLVFSTLRKREKNNTTLNVFTFIISKYWRMTPPLGLMITMLFILPVLNSGPLWNSTLDPPVTACLTNWWTNILYINNFWDCDQYCLIHTWYLATLMQCHVVGIFLLVLSFRWPRIAFSLAFIIGTCCSALTAIFAAWYDFPMPAPATMRDIEMFVRYTSKIYGKFFCHVSSYLIGMAVAYLFLKYKDPKIKMRYIALGWLLAAIGALSSIYGLYIPSNNVQVVALYIAGHRIVWTLSIGWLAFACITGYGGIVNHILSWKAFIPLGHLSYLAYLIHPLVMLFKTASLRERIYYGHTEHVFEFFSYAVISYLLSFIGYITVEMPFSSLAGLFFSSQSSTNLLKPKGNKDSTYNCSMKKIEQ